MDKEEYIEELKERAHEAQLKSNPTWSDKYDIWLYEEALKDSHDISDYNEGEEREISDGEKLASNKIKDGFGNDFPEWFRECGKHFNEKVKMDDKECTLIGMSETFVDYYYIVLNKGKKEYWSCVGKIEFLR